MKFTKDEYAISRALDLEDLLYDRFRAMNTYELSGMRLYSLIAAVFIMVALLGILSASINHVQNLTIERKLEEAGFYFDFDLFSCSDLSGMIAEQMEIIEQKKAELKEDMKVMIQRK